MKKEQHFTGNDLPVRFDILVDGKPIKPYSVTVDVYKPEVKFLFSELFRPKTSEVFYVLKKKNIDIKGQYVFVFNCRLAKYGMQSHVVKIDVEELPVKKK